MKDLSKLKETWNTEVQEMNDKLKTSDIKVQKLIDENTKMKTNYSKMFDDCSFYKKRVSELEGFIHGQGDSSFEGLKRIIQTKEDENGKLKNELIILSEGMANFLALEKENKELKEGVIASNKKFNTQLIKLEEENTNLRREIIKIEQEHGRTKLQSYVDELKIKTKEIELLNK